MAHLGGGGGNFLSEYKISVSGNENIHPYKACSWQPKEDFLPTGARYNIYHTYVQPFISKIFYIICHLRYMICQIRDIIKLHFFSFIFPNELWAKKEKLPHCKLGEPIVRFVVHR